MIRSFVRSRFVLFVFRQITNEIRSRFVLLSRTRRSAAGGRPIGKPLNDILLAAETYRLSSEPLPIAICLNDKKKGQQD